MKDMQRDERATSAAGLKKIAEKVWRRITPKYLKKLYADAPTQGGSHCEPKGTHKILNRVYILSRSIFFMNK